MLNMCLLGDPLLLRSLFFLVLESLEKAPMPSSQHLLRMFKNVRAFVAFTSYHVFFIYDERDVGGKDMSLTTAAMNI